MWLFSFMHSCIIFFKNKTVQTLGPIHKKTKFAINTGIFFKYTFFWSKFDNYLLPKLKKLHFVLPSPPHPT